MRFRMMLAILIALAPVTPAAAQKTEDEARLAFTMALAYTSGTDLWSVENQPILVPPPGIGFDQVDLTRRISGSIGVLFSGMYFPKPALGIVGEAFFMGIGLEDDCAVSSASPSVRTVEVCDDINGASKRSSAVLLSLGPVFRVGANQPISPYARAQVGLLISNLSPILMEGDIQTGGGGFRLVIYDDQSNTRVTTGFVFGAGVTSALGKGWQLRAEVRDNLVSIATVAGPTAPGQYEPEVVNEWKSLVSIVIGVDIVLEKKRGRRY
jgi:hypothetical protein